MGSSHCPRRQSQEKAWVRLSAHWGGARGSKKGHSLMSSWPRRVSVGPNPHSTLQPVTAFPSTWVPSADGRGEPKGQEGQLRDLRQPASGGLQSRSIGGSDRGSHRGPPRGHVVAPGRAVGEQHRSIWIRAGPATDDRSTPKRRRIARDATGQLR